MNDGWGKGIRLIKICFGSLPLAFEANFGEVDEQVDFFFTGEATLRLKTKKLKLGTPRP